MRSGDLSTKLLRPVHPFHQYAASDLGQRIVLLSLLLPVLIVRRDGASASQSMSGQRLLPVLVVGRVRGLSYVTRAHPAD